MYTLNFKILNKSWHLRVLNPKPYDKKKKRKNSLGVTFSWKRRIDLHVEAIAFSEEAAKELIVHELYHAYKGEMCVHSATEITIDDVEEIDAELMAKRGRELLDLADTIYMAIAPNINTDGLIEGEKVEYI